MLVIWKSGYRKWKETQPKRRTNEAKQEAARRAPGQELLVSGAHRPRVYQHLEVTLQRTYHHRMALGRVLKPRCRSPAAGAAVHGSLLLAVLVKAPLPP